MNRPLSLYLDLLRCLAAVAVYLFHASYFAGARIPLFGSFGSEAVIVFFVLSGFLVMAAARRQPDAGRFVQARLSRLWSVCLPALLLTLVVDTIGQYLSLSSYQPMQPYSVFKWLASMTINGLFVNQIWAFNVFPGTNGPFWSLSYEFWYYMIFAACFYLQGRKRIIAVTCAALIAGPSILLAFPVWLLGVGVYIALDRMPAGPNRKGLMLWIGSFVAALLFSQFGLRSTLLGMFPEIAADARWGVNFWPASYLIGAIVAANIYGFAVGGAALLPLLEKISGLIRFGAGVSFGLYLFHYPLMYFSKAVLNAGGMSKGLAYVIAIYLLPLCASCLLAYYAEKHKNVTASAVGRIAGRVRKLWSKRLAPKPVDCDGISVTERPSV